MKYDLSKEIDKNRFKTRCNKLFLDGKIVELKAINPNRTIKQNAYLHLILTHFAIEYGETLEYTKQHFFKRVCNPETFVSTYTNRKTGEVREDVLSTANLDTHTLTICIDRFRDWSAKQGIYLPTPDEREYLMQIEIEKEYYKEYL